MKHSKDIINKRRKNLLLLINELKKSTNINLAEKLNVSLPTIRRDIEYLHNKNLIYKYHGYVSAISSNEIRKSITENKKNQIAKIAATLINDDDIIFINSAYTSIQSIKYIEPSKFVSVITNNGNVLTMHTLPKIKIILTGGEIKKPKSALTGEFALNNIINTQANKAILGANGFHITEGITTANIDEVAINKAMIERANKVILCVDSSKLNHKSAFVSGDVRDVDILITNSDADPEIIESLKLFGIECILVDENGIVK
ncbi:DeoR/GlpR family DNA-binding transcription regulator [Helcococcus ovis]|uniref:DeoR/GlpR family DNA-binding transcription regulator n=1 Tax=Helcococcus ovis TaxID=72026 RepID=UPI0038B9F869